MSDLSPFPVAFRMQVGVLICMVAVGCTSRRGATPDPAATSPARADLAALFDVMRRDYPTWCRGQDVRPDVIGTSLASLFDMSSLRYEATRYPPMPMLDEGRDESSSEHSPLVPPSSAWNVRDIRIDYRFDSLRSEWVVEEAAFSLVDPTLGFGANAALVERKAREALTRTFGKATVGQDHRPRWWVQRNGLSLQLSVQAQDNGHRAPFLVVHREGGHLSTSAGANDTLWNKLFSMLARWPTGGPHHTDIASSFKSAVMKGSSPDNASTIATRLYKAHGRWHVGSAYVRFRADGDPQQQFLSMRRRIDALMGTPRFSYQVAGEYADPPTKAAYWWLGHECLDERLTVSLSLDADSDDESHPLVLGFAPYTEE